MSIQRIKQGVYLGSAATFRISSATKGATAPTPLPTNVTISSAIAETSTAKSKKIVTWGSNNSGPKSLLKDINKIGSAGKALEISADAHFGTGLSVYREDDEGRKKTIPFRTIPKLAEFDRINNWNLYYSESILDYETHEMMFTEYCLTNNYEDIAFIKRHDPFHCRFEEMNQNTGKIEHVFLNADWENYEDKTTFEIPVFSMYASADAVKEECKARKITRFMVCYHSTRNGELYYNSPRWQAPFRNGWTDIILAVPEIKKKITEQQLNIQYLIHVSDDYFKSMFGRDNQTNEYVWDKMNQEDRDNEYESLVSVIDEHLSGIEASGRSLTVPMIKAGLDGKIVKSIEIEKIDSTTKEGALIAEAVAGHQEIYIAKGVDPCLPGASIPGTQNQSGSGSNKREAYTILCASKVRPRTVTLLPFYFVRDWNNWGDDLYGAFPNVVLTTLDKETSGQTEVMN